MVEQATGIVAERDNIELLLLVTVTRFFEQPVHALVVAPPRLGKSALVTAVTQTLPPCSIQRLIGSSALSLLAHYLKEGNVIEWKEAPHHWYEQSLPASILRAVLWQQPKEQVDLKRKEVRAQWAKELPQPEEVLYPRPLFLFGSNGLRFGSSAVSRKSMSGFVALGMALKRHSPCGAWKYCRHLKPFWR